MRKTKVISNRRELRKRSGKNKERRRRNSNREKGHYRLKKTLIMRLLVQS
jgi:hypothetical protein